MRRKIVESPTAGYGICVRHSSDTVGWLTGKDAKVLSFQSAEEAQKALRQMKRDHHYSWNCDAQVDQIPQNITR